MSRQKSKESPADERSEMSSKAPNKPKAEPKRRAISEHLYLNCQPVDGLHGTKRAHPGLPCHNSAAALHCWAQCAHHEAAEMRLSDDDYAAAIKAVNDLDARGVPSPHQPALYVVKGS